MLLSKGSQSTRLISCGIILVSFLVCFETAFAGKPARPHWSLEVKGGRFTPDLDNYETFYGKDDTSEFALGFGYKFLRQLEVGAQVTYIADEGVGLLPLNQILGGEVTYTLVPLDVFVLFRAIFKENQWVVPYVGGGWTRAYYEQEITNQETVKGKADGYNARAGIQISLNNMAPKRAYSSDKEIGLRQSYLTLEARKFSAKQNGVDLGGTSYLLGFLFEF